MGETLAGLLWSVVGIYLTIGILFAVPFVLLGVGQLDPAAQKGNWGFRLAILPGVAALWPFLLLKTLHAMRGHYGPPEAEQAATAARLRRLHGWAMMLLVLVVPIVCVGALLSRPREVHSTVEQIQSQPLPQVLPLASSRAGELPVEVALRTDGMRYQVQLDITQPLEDPVVALYWSAEPSESGVAKDAVFLGSLWGPSRLLFSLPSEARTTPGVLTLLALSGDQRVIASLPLLRK